MRFFIDEVLDGDRFVDVLLTAGVELVRHRHRFQKGEEDAVWIPIVSEEGLVILSADVRVRYTPLEKASLLGSQARILFLLQGKSSTHPQMAELFVRSLKRVEAYFSREHPPVAGVLRPLPSSKDPLGRRSGVVHTLSMERGADGSSRAEIREQKVAVLRQALIDGENSGDAG